MEQIAVWLTCKLFSDEIARVCEYFKYEREDKSNTIIENLERQTVFRKSCDVDFLKGTVDDDGLDGRDGIRGREEKSKTIIENPEKNIVQGRKF